MKKNKTSSKDARHLYTEKYFLNDATGHNEFKGFDGTYNSLIDKFRIIIQFMNLSTTDALLDIGCGRGELVIFHSINGGKATGVDFSEEAINLAREKAKELNAGSDFIVSSFEDIDEKTKFDRIVSNDFIEHISAEEGNMFFKKCYALMNPGGRLVVYTYPNTIRRKYGYKLIRLFSMIKMKPIPRKEPDTVSEHYKLYHLNEQNYFNLRKMALTGGFRKVKVQYFDPSIKDSILKSLLVHTPMRHLFMKGLLLTADK
jgi:cyclopropane fatty-acyl-phospholipid synthase-like methyltransferase